jgi:putative transposase
MFEDEASFGRISEPGSCWAPKGIRPIVPRHRIKEYMYAYGAVEPLTGDSYFLVLPGANTACMNAYLEGLSNEFPDDYILLPLDGASYHGSKALIVPKNIELFTLLPYTPEMNPTEQIWKEIRTEGFKNESFPTLAKVVDRLCDTIMSLTTDTKKSITGREWILSMF